MHATACAHIATVAASKWTPFVFHRSTGEQHADFRNENMLGWVSKTPRHAAEGRGLGVRLKM